MTDDRAGLFDIRGRTALITGSTRGIGRALATGLSHAGCTVIVNARDSARVAETAEAIAGETGGTVHGLAFDASAPAEVSAALARIDEIAPPIDILINNVGVQHRAPITEVTDEAWYRLVETNLGSAFFVGRAVAGRMVPRGSGKIINICSVQSELVRPGIAPYSATKGALKLLTRGMCADLAPSGIQVNAIGPGYMDTEMTASLVADEHFSAWIRGRTPAGRWGRPADLLGAAIFLSSPASDFVNGQILYVDGGMVAVL